MSEPRPAPSAIRIRLEAALAALADELGRWDGIGQAVGDVRPDPAGVARPCLTIHGKAGGTTLLSPPQPLSDALLAAAGGRLHAIRNRDGGERAWLHDPTGTWIAARRPEEPGAHARLRQAARLEARPLLRWLHQDQAGRPIRIHREGARAFVCILHPGPAMADSFHLLHLGGTDG